MGDSYRVEVRAGHKDKVEEDSREVNKDNTEDWDSTGKLDRKEVGECMVHQDSKYQVCRDFHGDMEFQRHLKASVENRVFLLAIVMENELVRLRNQGSNSLLLFSKAVEVVGADTVV